MAGELRLADAHAEDNGGDAALAPDGRCMVSVLGRLSILVPKECTHTEAAGSRSMAEEEHYQPFHPKNKN
jgi:hypothetical protein